MPSSRATAQACCAAAPPKATSTYVARVVALGDRDRAESPAAMLALAMRTKPAASSAAERLAPLRRAFQRAASASRRSTRRRDRAETENAPAESGRAESCNRSPSAARRGRSRRARDRRRRCRVRRPASRRRSGRSSRRRPRPFRSPSSARRPARRPFRFRTPVRRSAVEARDVGAGAAHVEADRPREAGRLRDAREANHAAGRSGENAVLADEVRRRTSPPAEVSSRRSLPGSESRSCCDVARAAPD